MQAQNIGLVKVISRQHKGLRHRWFRWGTEGKRVVWTAEKIAGVMRCKTEGSETVFKLCIDSVVLKVFLLI